MTLPYRAVLNAVNTVVARLTCSVEGSKSGAVDIEGGAGMLAAPHSALAPGRGAEGGPDKDQEDFIAALAGLKCIQRTQAAVVSLLRGARRIIPALAMKAPQLACHPVMLLAGCAADRAMAAVTPPSLLPQTPSMPLQPGRPGKEGERELLLASSKLASITSVTVVPQLLQYGGSRVALATAAHLCRRVLQPHPELQSALLLPLVHLLAFSSWTVQVNAKGTMRYLSYTCT